MRKTSQRSAQTTVGNARRVLPPSPRSRELCSWVGHMCAACTGVCRTLAGNATVRLLCVCAPEDVKCDMCRGWLKSPCRAWNLALCKKQAAALCEPLSVLCTLSASVSPCSRTVSHTHRVSTITAPCPASSTARASPRAGGPARACLLGTLCRARPSPSPH